MKDEINRSVNFTFLSDSMRKGREAFFYGCECKMIISIKKSYIGLSKFINKKNIAKSLELLL